MGSKKQSVEQTQQVSQSTQVTVQNVIEDAGLSPLEQIKILGDLFVSLDTAQAAKQQQPQTVVIVPPGQGPADFLKDPRAVLVLAALGAGFIWMLRKRR